MLTNQYITQPYIFDTIAFLCCCFFLLCCGLAYRAAGVPHTQFNIFYMRNLYSVVSGRSASNP